LVSRQEWPRLETMYLADLARKCWTGDITSATELLNAACSAITDLGVLIRNNDEIFDVNLDGLTMSGVRSLRRSHGIVNKVLLLFMLSTR
jgi:hypothetical protein